MTALESSLLFSSSGAKVDIVEIDGAVIRAAIESMGFPPCLTRSSRSKVPALSSMAAGRSDLGQYEELHGGTKAGNYSGQEYEASEEVLYGSTLRSMTLYEADGEAFVVELEQQESRRKPSLRQYYDVVFVDAYDGDDMVPTNLWARNGPFLTSLNQLLHPKHGTAVVCLPCSYGLFNLFTPTSLLHFALQGTLSLFHL